MVILNTHSKYFPTSNACTLNARFNLYNIVSYVIYLFAAFKDVNILGGHEKEIQ